VLAGRRSAPREIAATAIRRLNQLTAPVAAKAVEDTAFYRDSRLLSRNDVGFDPGRMALTSAAFIDSGQARSRDWPRAMLTTATHDHKRGEDVRARLAVLSECAEDWASAVEAWLTITKDDRPDCIAADDAYALFQTLVGAWPFELSPTDADGLAAFGDRVAGWREKSLREAKLRSSWAAPDATYEAANQAWLSLLLNPDRSAAFVDRIAPAGAINGVVQAALRCAWPGVPVLYQGAELWDLSLVDPDNRRPVDYELRARLLANPSPSDWRTGRVKQAEIARLLALRRADPDLFTLGALEPLDVRGARADHVLAFERRHQGRRAAVAVMLRISEPVDQLGRTPSADWWADTAISDDGDWRGAPDLFAGGPVWLETSGF
jgi:(1->4)-alpha-D-glucan 1-alpha-D-glucosylmutase